jgi:hypothetical protein
MEIKSTEPGPRLNHDQQGVGLNNTGELNLYLDLLAFSELPPEEQLVAKERLKDAVSNPVFQSPVEFPGFVETGDTFNGILSSSETSEPLETGEPLFDSLPEWMEAEQPACDPLEFLEPAATSDPVFEFLPEWTEAEQIETVAPMDAPAPAVVAADVPAPIVEADNLFRASGPLSLSGLLYDPTLKSSAQIVTLVICPACGSEADGEDLFCVACGAFMDETAADESSRDETSGLVCDDCGLVVETDELICPSCGSASPV